ncbi:MAG: hypothetical protein K2X68_02780 [Novosphingobium sp.]|nr:hypothetical protein [Novosphingobium sp.]
MRDLIAISLLITLGGCASAGLGLPKTAGERAAGYGYVPLDPLPIETVGTAGSCREKRYFGSPGDSSFLPMTQALPDVAVRFAVAQFKGNGGLQFGPTAVTAKNENYRAILDFVNSDSVTIRILLRQHAKINGITNTFSLSEHIDKKRGDTVFSYQAKLIPDQTNFSVEQKTAKLSPAQMAAISGEGPDVTGGWTEVAFPIYIGVGFRLTADFQALEGNLSLGGLGAIGANADSKKLTGSMTLQSIGVNGLGTTTALALPNKLDQTTIEQSILAIGTGRALIYTNPDEAKVRLSPRVIGLYSPVGSDPRLINAVYSEL